MTNNLLCYNGKKESKKEGKKESKKEDREMSLLMDDYLECLSRGYGHSDKSICHDCVSNYALKSYIIEKGEMKICSYCGRRRKSIDLTKITSQYLTEKGYSECQVVSRDILNKRTPPITSIVKDEPVESMKKEYVLIYKKA